MMGKLQNKRVFLTGHTGFKGAWLTCMLQQMGAEVMGYSLEPNTQPSLFNAIGGDKLCHSVIGDIRDTARLHKAMTDFQPDVVFHLAAQPIVRTSYKIPAETFEVNAIGTANVLDGIRLLEKKCTGVMITTDKVYQNNETGQAYKEDDSFGGYDPYSASKACAELVIDSYRKSFFNANDYDNHQKAVASARAGNVIGGGDWAADRLVPDIVRALSQDKPIQIRNPKAIRPWQHVLEPLSGYVLLAEKLMDDPFAYAEGFNFGPNPADTLTVEEMTQLAVKIWGSGEFVFPQLTNQPHEAGLLSLDITKAQNVLGWKPRLNAQEALEYTLAWYKAYYNNPAEARALTYEQIETFLNK